MWGELETPAAARSGPNEWTAPPAALEDPGAAAAVVGERLRAGETVPGFGHAVYNDRDPRADALLALLPPGRRSAVIEAVLRLTERLDAPAPNVDFAVGALSATAGLAPGSAEAVFAVARTAGLIAHAIEEYPRRLRFRPRAAYTGPPPTAPESSA